jgi:hypothetical protein
MAQNPNQEALQPSLEKTEGNKAEKLVTADEIIAALSGMEKATNNLKADNNKRANEYKVDPNVAREKAASRLGKSRGLILADVAGPDVGLGGKKQNEMVPTFDRGGDLIGSSTKGEKPQVFQKVPGGVVGSDGRRYMEVPGGVVPNKLGTKPNLKDTDISNLGKGKIIDPKTGEEI